MGTGPEEKGGRLKRRPFFPLKVLGPARVGARCIYKTLDYICNIW